MNFESNFFFFLTFFVFFIGNHDIHIFLVFITKRTVFKGPIILGPLEKLKTSNLKQERETLDSREMRRRAKMDGRYQIGE